MSKEGNLTPTEKSIYATIKNAAEEYRLASAEEIYRVLYGEPVPSHQQVTDTLAPQLSRLKSKLPPGEIVNKDGLGYFSKSATES